MQSIRIFGGTIAHMLFAYVVLCRLLAQWRFRRGVEKQMQVLMKGVQEFVPSHLLRLFDERELEVSQ